MSLIVYTSSDAQFPQQWMGDWKGTMHIYKSGKVVDSVGVTHTVKPAADAGSYVWKTEYHSTKMPVTKDYMLRTKDAANGIYVIDEGVGLELKSYLMGNRLLSMFEVGGVLLTANYELQGNTLVFEVTSSRKDSATGGGVTNYAVTTLQRVVLKRILGEQ